MVVKYSVPTSQKIQTRYRGQIVDVVRERNPLLFWDSSETNY
jgi:hypothetical protein